MNVNHLFCVAKTRFIYAKHKFFIYEVNKKIAKQLSRSLGEAKTRFIYAKQSSRSLGEAKTRFIYAKQLSRSLGEAKTRFISPLGEICIDEVNKGLRSNQTAVSSSRKAKLKNFQAA